MTIVLPERRRERSRDVHAEVRALEAEARALRLEREAQQHNHHGQVIIAQPQQSGYEMVEYRERRPDREIVEYVERDRSPKREVIRVEKDRKGRMALVRSARWLVCSFPAWTAKYILNTRLTLFSPAAEKERKQARKIAMMMATLSWGRSSTSTEDLQNLRQGVMCLETILFGYVWQKEKKPVFLILLDFERGASAEGYSCLFPKLKASNEVYDLRIYAIIFCDTSSASDSQIFSILLLSPWTCLCL
jgi:hypothetical protein